ncbi:MAG: hypothetical protein CK536_05475 [Synechococcus sp. Baikal-G1]|nr:MAG: hypothetical protein CK536_05475 [Synechococcus sp. Baikal-G1]
MRIFVASSMAAVGVKVPVQVMPPLEVVIAERTPFSTVISALLLKAVTASEKVRVTVAVSPILRALSESMKDETAGGVESGEIIVNDREEGLEIATGIPGVPRAIDVM